MISWYELVLTSSQHNGLFESWAPKERESQTEATFPIVTGHPKSQVTLPPHIVDQVSYKSSLISQWRSVGGQWVIIGRPSEMRKKNNWKTQSAAGSIWKSSSVSKLRMCVCEDTIAQLLHIKHGSNYSLRFWFPVIQFLAFRNQMDFRKGWCIHFLGMMHLLFFSDPRIAALL